MVDVAKIVTQIGKACKYRAKSTEISILVKFQERVRRVQT
jgi:hypothetical protein